MKTKFNKGNELDKQIYKEGDSSLGLKEGFLDVEDVKDFIKELKEEYGERSNVHLIHPFILISFDDLDKIVGDKLK